MKLTIKDVAKATTERAIRDSSEGSYKDAMTRQLERLEALIEKIENIEV